MKAPSEERLMKMRKIIGCLALVIALCLCLSACRPGSSGSTESTTEPVAETGSGIEDEIQETDTQITMPNRDMPDQHEGDYELPPGERPEVTVGDQ